jgi:hypothetical protein
MSYIPIESIFTGSNLSNGVISGNNIKTNGISQGHILSGYMDLSSNQNISGIKTFANSLIFKNIVGTDSVAIQSVNTIRVNSQNPAFKWGTGTSQQANTHIGSIYAGFRTGASDANDGTVALSMSHSGQKVNVNDAGGTFPGQLTVFPTAAVVGIVSRGAASQTANLQEWQNSAGTVLAGFTPQGTGRLALGSGVAGSVLHIFGADAELGGAGASDAHWVRLHHASTSNGIGMGISFYTAKTNNNGPFRVADISTVISDHSDTGASADIVFGTSDGIASVTERGRIGKSGGYSIGNTAEESSWLTISGSMTNKSSMRLKPGGVPGVPASGDVWNDSDRKGFYFNTHATNTITQNIPGVILTTTGLGAFANTTSETSIVGGGIGTATLPANFFTPGKTIRVIARGVYNTDAVTPGNLNIKINLGGTTVAQTGAQTLTNAVANRHFDTDVILTCRSTGVGGLFMSQGMTHLFTTAVATTLEEMTNTGFVVVDTTASKLLDVTATFSAADADNNISGTNVIFEVLN